MAHPREAIRGGAGLPAHNGERGFLGLKAVSVQLADYEPYAGALTITGKGNRQRLVYATGGGKEAIEAWLADCGDWDGALLAPVNKGGAVQPRPVTAQAC